MPVFLDIHKLDSTLTPEQVAQAHSADMAVQAKHGVNYARYWFNQKQGKVFCLCTAPDALTARRVHEEAHGLVAEKVIEVDPDVLESFLGGGEDSVAGEVMLAGGEQHDTAIRTILFTDLVGSTDMTQRLGDDAAMDQLRVHDGIAREALLVCNGREIKHTGDGIMASFVSAVSAMRCAIRIQQQMTLQSSRAGAYPLRVRIGSAVGEPVERNNDIFGTTVQLASRLCAQAEPGQIVVASALSELCGGKGLIFEELGELALKGFDRPVRAHRVRWSVDSAV